MAHNRTPRYALVIHNDCIAHALLADLPEILAASIDTWVLAREDDVLSEPLPPMDMTLLSNPRRFTDEGGD